MKSGVLDHRHDSRNTYERAIGSGLTWTLISAYGSISVKLHTGRFYFSELGIVAAATAEGSERASMRRLIP